MMPLLFANVDEEYVIRKVKGKPEMKKHLEDLGFTPGGTVTVVSKNGGNLIVRVKESRLALDRELAMKIDV